MITRDTPPPHIRTAIVISIGFHVCLLAVLALLLGNGPAAVETAGIRTQWITIVTIAHHPTRIVPRVTNAVPTPLERRIATPLNPVIRSANSVVPPQVRVKAQRLATVISASVPSTRARILAQSTIPLEPRGTPSAQRLALAAPLATPTPTPKPTTTPVITPSPIVTAAATPSAPSRSTFDGLFSQNYPPAFPPASEVVSQIRARLGEHARVRISVDENGRATDVQFLGAATDPALQPDIRAALLALRYTPADCNGLHCDGTLDVPF